MAKIKDKSKKTKVKTDCLGLTDCFVLLCRPRNDRAHKQVMQKPQRGELFVEQEISDMFGRRSRDLQNRQMFYRRNRYER